MSTEFTSKKYATIDDYMDSLGMSEADQANVSQTIRARFALWVTEGNNNVEGEVSKESDDTNLTADTPEFTFAKNAVMNWCVYKQRTLLGSANAKQALTDYEKTIENLHKILIKTRTTRTKTVSIKGASQKNQQILLPSQIDTQFF